MTGAAEGSLLIALYSTFSMRFHVQLLDDLTTFIIITDIPSELQVRRTLGTGIVHAQKDSNNLRLPFITCFRPSPRYFSYFGTFSPEPK